MKAPSILFIMADQLAGPALPMYGNSNVKTPHLQKLAENGVTFSNAYCNNPVCAPSRSSMMSGQLCSNIGVYDNAAEFSASTPTIAHYLRDLNYKTSLSGKMHFIGPDQLHGYEERLTTDIYPSDFVWTPDWSRKDYPFSPATMSMRSVVEAGLCKRSLQIDYDEEVAFQANRKLYDIARKNDDQPFFLTVSFTHPHNPYTTTQEYWDRYSHDEINMPSVPFIPFEERDPWSQRYYHLIRQDEHDVTDEMIRTARHAYYGMISYVDDKVGELLNTLENTGLAENTIVVFSSDHGDMLGERGMWYKFNPFEWSTRIPMIISAPNGAKGRVENKGVSLVDLLPTFLDLATDGNPPKLSDRTDGHSFAKLIFGEDPSWKDDVMIEYTGEGIYSPCLILRKNGFKYIYCEDDPGMLFDLNNDPKELDNLCGKPEYADKEKEMLDIILKRWDTKSIKKNIIESQKRRLFLQEVLLKGKHTSWDFQPYKNASKTYVRSSREANVTLTKGLARMPYVEPVPPDHPRNKESKVKYE